MKNYTPQEVYERLKAQAILLIDVREPEEYAVEHIDGALSYPLSAFNPAALPDGGGREVVFHCLGGMRSASAVSQCRTAALAFDAHMEGGLKAWKSAGLPTVTA